MSAKHVVIVGGGVVGMSTAIWLRRRGCDVTVVDPGEPEKGASFGNGGVLAACSVVPVTVPGLLRKAPRLALDPSFPLFVRWAHLPRLLPWLVRYLGHANAADVARISRGLAPLLRDTLAQHRDLAAGTPAERWLRPSAYLFAYPSRQAFEAEALVWKLRRDAGFTWEELEADALRALDPALGPGVRFGVLLQDHGLILDPGAYVQDLADHAEATGCRRVRGRAHDILLHADGSAAGVIADGGAITGDAVVVAAGAWSKPMTAKLGLSVPLETERGYHVMLRGASVAPRLPTMVAAGKFVMTPMSGGLRIAGVIEFGGLDAPAGREPIELMLSKLRETYPSLAYERADEWLGHRPAPSDSLPLIGEVPGRRGAYLAFGHHHVGLTGGPKTGRALAALIAGEDPGMDMGPYDPARFARRRAA